MNIDQVPSSHENHHEDLPNITSAEQLLADIPGRMATADSVELKVLVSDIKEKIDALGVVQEQAPKATNIRNAIARLNLHLEEIKAKTPTIH